MTCSNPGYATVVRSRGSSKWYQELQANSKQVLNEALYNVNAITIQITSHVFNTVILEQPFYLANGNVAIFIKFLWYTLGRIQNACSSTITEHTHYETKQAFSLLLPYVYTCLASNVSAMAIHHQNPQVRVFLLFGSFIYFKKGYLPGRLKFISLLYALGLYKDCEWWLDQLDEEFIKFSPSFCYCRYIKNDLTMTYAYIIQTSNLTVLTCISFLPSEIQIIPDTLTFEMFRYFGISLTKTDKTFEYCLWHYRAVVDCNIYFYLLKYVTKKKLGNISDYKDAIDNIYTLLHVFGRNIRHRDVANNVLAWIFCSEQLLPLAIICLSFS